MNLTSQLNESRLFMILYLLIKHVRKNLTNSSFQFLGKNSSFVGVVLSFIFYPHLFVVCIHQITV